MNEIIISLMIILLVFLLLVFLISTLRTNRKHTQSEPPKPRQKGKMTTDEFMHVLDFMLAMSIIDHKQYNQLLIKSLPFVE